jgi:hypothetical protein
MKGPRGLLLPICLLLACDAHRVENAPNAPAHTSTVASGDGSASASESDAETSMRARTLVGLGPLSTLLGERTLEAGARFDIPLPSGGCVQIASMCRGAGPCKLELTLGDDVRSWEPTARPALWENGQRLCAFGARTLQLRAKTGTAQAQVFAPAANRGTTSP